MSKGLMEEKKIALFLDERGYIEKEMGNEKWVEVYSSETRENQSKVRYCGLVKSSEVENCLSNPNWDISIGDGFPGCRQYFEEGNEIVEYDRYSFSYIEPLVFKRNYHGFVGDIVEVAEEFRFFS